MKREILILGNENLYDLSKEVNQEELPVLKTIIGDLHDTLMDFRSKYGSGRAIAAPQIGIKKRIIYMNIGEPVVIINPVLEFSDEDTMTVMDDCMSFPGLYVKVLRYRRCRIKYYDNNWKQCEMQLEGDLSELIQHEYDHLDGILATMRAIDNKSYYMKRIPC